MTTTRRRKRKFIRYLSIILLCLFSLILISSSPEKQNVKEKIATFGVNHPRDVLFTDIIKRLWGYWTRLSIPSPFCQKILESLIGDSRRFPYFLLLSTCDALHVELWETNHGLANLCKKLDCVAGQNWLCSRIRQTPSWWSYLMLTPFRSYIWIKSPYFNKQIFKNRLRKMLSRFPKARR